MIIGDVLIIDLLCLKPPFEMYIKPYLSSGDCVRIDELIMGEMLDFLKLDDGKLMYPKLHDLLDSVMYNSDANNKLFYGIFYELAYQYLNLIMDNFNGEVVDVCVVSNYVLSVSSI